MKAGVTPRCHGDASPLSPGRSRRIKRPDREFVRLPTEPNHHQKEPANGYPTDSIIRSRTTPGMTSDQRVQQLEVRTSTRARCLRALAVSFD
jgi:hypothetical protein